MLLDWRGWNTSHDRVCPAEQEVARVVHGFESLQDESELYCVSVDCLVDGGWDWVDFYFSLLAFAGGLR